MYLKSLHMVKAKKMSNDIKKYIKYVKKIIPIHSKDKKEFIKYLQFQKHYSINTVESYQRSLNEFIGFLKSESISHFNDVKYTNIRGYLTYLNEKKLSKCLNDNPYFRMEVG